MASIDLFDAALAEEGVTGQLAKVARGIYMQESGGGRNTRTSNAGAMGGMQIIPSTFNSVADKGWDINDPMHNARAGIRYIKQLDKLAGGDPALIGAGYYGGPGGLAKAKKGINTHDPRNPSYPGTLEYGQKLANYVGGNPAPKTVTPIKAGGTQPVLLAQNEVPSLPVVDKTPVEQVMQSTPVEQVAQVATPVPQEWQQFQERMPQQMQAEDLQFGNPGFSLPQIDTRAYALNAPKIDFSAFKRVRRRV